MSFDKAKAMRNAERHVAQGKIRSAIDEYRSVVDHDPRDIATLNMLGDLYAKSSDKDQAVNCYMGVADHYNKQGFPQKAIAVYNKIARLQPDSVEVCTKLAELHKVKGSLSEARAHYSKLAEHFQKAGKRLESLAMLKQIAHLDPNNADVCLNLADSYLRENQRDDALEAFAEAGARLTRRNRHEEAIRALMKGFDLNPTDLRVLNGLVRAHTAQGRANKAVSLLEEIIENEPYNRDVLYLLIECCIDVQDTAGAERAVVRLVEIEPANYLKFLDLINIYVKNKDFDSACRVLNMSAEYLLAGGQAEECGKWLNEILEKDPAHIGGLRLLIRYNSWLHDPNGVRLALERLYASASIVESIEDERYALAQLAVIRPHETRYRDRLNEINTEYDFSDDGVDETLWTEGMETDSQDADPLTESASEYGFEMSNGEDLHGEIVDAQIIGDTESRNGNGNGHHRLSHSEEVKLQKELESIDFYIENDYRELAEKAVLELEKEFGRQPVLDELRERLGMDTSSAAEVTRDDEVLEAEEIVSAEEIVDVEEVTAAEDVVEVEEAPATDGTAPTETRSVEGEVVGGTFGIDEIRSEFGLEEGDTEAEMGDYETHFQMGIAYKEMGLIEEAIRELQDAANLTRQGDKSRRFFYCANLLGHCFLQNGMAQHAITWFGRALECPGITDEEQHGIWYELAQAHQVNGDEEAATTYFEKIYAENVDFRDVGDKVRNLVAD